MKYLWIPVILLLLSCTNNPDVKNDDAKSAESLVGVWRGAGTYSDEEDSGWTESWRMERVSDGTYKVDYMIVHDGDKLYEQSSDAGTWSYKDGVYYEVNGNSSRVTYDVFLVKNDRFEYNIANRQATANIEETKTVEDFQLPAPPEDYSLVTYDQPALETLEKPEDMKEEINNITDEVANETE